MKCPISWCTNYLFTIRSAAIPSLAIRLMRETSPAYYRVTLDFFDGKIRVGINANLAGDAHRFHGEILRSELRVLD